MSWPKSVNLSKRAAKDIHTIPPIFRKAIQAAIEDLAVNPMLGTALKPPFLGLRRYRVADYRIVYEFDQTALSIVAIKHRKDVYR